MFLTSYIRLELLTISRRLLRFPAFLVLLEAGTQLLSQFGAA